jgi:hypothetical protein
MKDGRTHLKYKAENAVDLETQIIVAAQVYHGDYGDTLTIEDTVVRAGLDGYGFVGSRTSISVTFRLPWHST